MADEAQTEKAPEAEAATAPVEAAPAPAAVEAAPAPVEAPKPARARRAKAVKAAPAPQPKAAAKPARRKAAPKKAARVAKIAAPVAAVAAAAVAKKVVKRNRIIKSEGTRTMKNEANKIADNVQALFGEANERARAQIERNTRFAEELTELGRGNVEAFVASTKVAAKGVETIGQEVAEYSRKSFEEASAALKAFAEVKSPTDFFRLQGEFARTQFDSLVAETSRFSETVVKLAGDVAQPLTSRYTVAAEKVKAAAAF
ncbi:MAG TPA: phasin family protein [Allosphingosinicella sp.]|nr:phasin family protein [Allosphingosinicella sp.]